MKEADILMTTTTKTDKQAIRKLNIQFKKSSAAGKRVLIAKDVISRIRSHQYDAQKGTWWHLLTLNGDEPLSLQAGLIGGEPCRCCALGALFLSCTALNNKLTVKAAYKYADLGDCIDTGQRIPNGLSRFFSYDQFSQIEAAFEGRSFFASSSSQCGAALSFYARYEPASASVRLLAIMCNIIKNKGTFKP